MMDRRLSAFHSSFVWTAFYGVKQDFRVDVRDLHRPRLPLVYCIQEYFTSDSSIVDVKMSSALNS